MESTVKELIDRIKSDGIQSAQESANQIVAEAEKKAQNILKDAEKEGAEIKEKAKKDIQRFEESSKSALIQSSRDVLLGVKTEVIALVERLIHQSIADSLTPETLQSVLLEVAKAFSSSPNKVEIQLKPDDQKKIENAVLGSLKNTLKSGVEIKPAPRLAKGFRIGESEGAAFFNFTPAEIAAVLSQMVSPKLKEILEESGKGA